MAEFLVVQTTRGGEKTNLEDLVEANTFNEAVAKYFKLFGDAEGIRGLWVCNEATGKIQSFSLEDLSEFIKFYKEREDML